MSTPIAVRAKARMRDRRAPGRPRSEHAHQAILRASLELLAERGYEGLTMEAIADRAGVGKTTVYRRWSSKEQVLAAAVVGYVNENPVPDTGSIHTDLLQIMRGAVRTYQGLPGRIMPGLVAAMAKDAGLAHAVREDYLAQRRSALREVMERGIRRGELREDTDVEVALDLLSGVILVRLLISGTPIDDHLAGSSVELLIRGIARAPGSAAPQPR